MDIRERIEKLRQQQSQVPTPKQVKQEMNENNKDALKGIFVQERFNGVTGRIV
jgi:hypothetical protein